MTNAQIADAFDLIADILEFQGANPFRVRAYRNGARAIRDLTDSVAAIVADPDRKLTDLEGIGDDLAAKCQTLVETGSLPMLEELKAEVPDTVLALMRIPGLGPKKAAALYKELKIATLEDLKKACEEHRVRELKGFGAKTEELILAGMAVAATSQERMLWAKADEVAQSLRNYIQLCPDVEKFELAGSYRRGKETVGDLDILVVSPNFDAVMDHLGAFVQVAETIARGDTKMSVRMATGLQVDLRVVPAESFGAALQYFTGSKEHNVILRGKAKAKGLKISEWGVFRVQDGNEEYIAGRTEEEVYATLNLPFFPPEIREARREFEWAAAGELPRLIELGDLVGDLHMHTTETDGQATLDEMIAAAKALGRKYIAITDHSKRVSMANGLNEERLLAQWKLIDEVNERVRGITVLKGIECDILEKGGMDLSNEVLAQADWVIASVHYGQKQSITQITDRILGALENPHVDVIAHPTGRLLNKREAYQVDINAVFEAAAANGKLLELNANPMRLDLNDVHCAAAKERGIPIVINTDAHSTIGLETLHYGVLQARRAGLTKEDVANTRSWAQLKKLMGQKKQ